VHNNNFLVTVADSTILFVSCREEASLLVIREMSVGWWKALLSFGDDEAAGSYTGSRCAIGQRISHKQTMK
jgi:hypothetical protein